MRPLGFKQIYTVIRCFPPKKLANLVYESEIETREIATDYENPSVELVAIQKIGFFTYFIVWKVQGYLKNT